MRSSLVSLAVGSFVVGSAAVFVGCNGPINVVATGAGVTEDGTPYRWRTEYILGASAPLPPGSVLRCYTPFNGKTYPVYTDPDGNIWTIDDDGDPHPFVGPNDPCPSTGGGPTQAPGPVQFGPHRSGGTTEILVYASGSFDTVADTVELTIAWPAAQMAEYQHADDMPFAVEETSFVFANGDRIITYSGSTNDVLGVLWMLGMSDITLDQPNIGEVKILWKDQVNMVTIETPLGSETMVLEFTAPQNLPAGW